MPNENIEWEELVDVVQDLADDIAYTRDVGLEVQKKPQDTVRAAKFDARISRLDDTFEKFLKGLSRLKILATSEESQKFYSQMRTEARSQFYHALSIHASINAKPSIQGEASPSVANSSFNASIRAAMPSFKLPTLNLPTFEGDLANWPVFKDTYQALIHSNPDLSVIQKYQYLRSSLKGAALQAIAIIPLTELEYPQAWAALLRKYEHKGLQAMNHLSKIFNYKPLTKVTLNNIHNLTEVVFESVTSFQQLHLENEGDFILFSYIFRLLTPQLREKFEASRTNPDEIPSLTDLVNFIHRQSLMLQSEACAAGSTMASGSGDTSTKPQHEVKHVFQVHEYPTYHIQCPFCQQNHLLFKCGKFRQLKALDRWSYVKANNICYNCLSATHPTRKCNSKHVCRICSEKHHTLIHLDFSPKQIDTKPNVTQPPGTTGNTSSTASETRPFTQHTVLSTATDGRTSVLLGTAQAHIRDHNGEWLGFRMVIDSGAQRSFITTNLTDRLGLAQRPNPENFRGFGDTPMIGGQRQVSCTISPMGRKGTLVTEAVIVDKISSHLPSYPVAENFIKKFAHLTLADTTFGQPGPIDFLLGADLFPHIISSSSSKVQGSPAAVSTIFGWVIMGRLPTIYPNEQDKTFMAVSTRLIEPLGNLKVGGRLTNAPLSEEAHQSIFKPSRTRRKDGPRITTTGTHARSLDKLTHYVPSH